MKIKEIFTKLGDAYEFASKGVWHSPKNTVWIRTIKTLNLAVSSFLDRDLQTRASSLTFNTLLALVPALALIFAIGRGFGLQDVLRDQLFSYFPAQKDAIEKTITFVDSYLNQSAQGVFVGVGIIVLLWTLISLLSSIEESFNFIWGLKKDRSFYQKLTDYIAVCLLVPILMICSSGVSLFISTVLQTNIHIPFLTPIVNWLLELFPLVLAWAAFSVSYLIIPNTKVKFKYAAISGLVAAVGFQIVQLLFLNGQIYVTKYNAIYGSFAFLPLLLVWLQLSWLILLSGCTLTYSLQNVFVYNYMADTSNISNNYMRKVALIVGAVVAERFENGEKPLTCNEISLQYGLPMRLVSNICDNLQQIDLINYVALDDDNLGVAPAQDVSNLSVGRFFKALDSFGDSEFIPNFNERYSQAMQEMDKWINAEWLEADKVLLKDIPITPAS